MASASSAVRICLSTGRRAVPRLQPLRRGPSAAAARQLSTSWARRADDTKPRQRDDNVDDDDGPTEPYHFPKMSKMLTESITLEGLQGLDEVAKKSGHNTFDEFLDSSFHEDYAMTTDERELLSNIKKIDAGENRNRSSFWYDDEDPDADTEEHAVFNEDDITSMAHGKLDEVREMRQYARQAVWEMPLLSKLAKPFAPPPEGHVLRWRYTTYMGESHPAEKKVVVQFAPDDLELTTKQRSKLKKLAGPRYNPETEFVKMSCESFEHQAQNKQYLLKLVDELIAAAKDDTDTFEDVPLDLRHHRIKEKPRFPCHWRLTNERRLDLAEHRRATATADLARAEQGRLVDGQRLVDTYLLNKAAKEKIEESIRMPGGDAAKDGKGSRSAKRRQAKPR